MRTLKQRLLSVIMSVMLVLSVVSGLGFSSAAEDGLVLADGSNAVVDEDESMVYVPGGQNYLTADYLKSQFKSDIEVDPEYNELFNGYKIKCAEKEYTVCIKGDIDSNGKITAADAQAILEISGNEEKAEQYGEYALKCADVNSDGKVTLMESRSVYRTAARMTASVLDSVNDIATDVSDEDPVVSFGVALGEDRGSFDLNISLNNIKNHFTSRIVLEYPSDISVLRCSKNYNGFFDVYAPLGNNKAVISFVSIDKIADDEADVCTVSFSVSDDYDISKELEISLTDESWVDDVIPVSGSVKFSLKEVTENEPKFKYEAISDNEICITGYSGSDEIVEIPEELTVAAAKECVTNCVKHADGNEVYIRIAQRGEHYDVTITNNGKIPTKPIKEGSGLSTLRRSIESSGGEMHISHNPRFALLITIPAKEISL